MQETSVRQKTILIIFGLFLCVVLLEAGLRIGRFVFLSLQEHRDIASILRKGTYRIMCLGESTTAGGYGSYPSQLEEILNERNIGIKFSVINRGLPSVNTTSIAGQLKDNLNKYQPEMVIVMMGINDYSIKYHKGAPDINTILSNTFRTYRFLRTVWIQIMSKEIWTSGCRYIEQGKFTQAEDSLKKAIELDPRNDRAYGALAVLYKEMGKYESAQECYKKANELRLEYYKPKTRNNYQKLKAILDKRGIRLVCVQYPVRSIEPLKKIFEGQERVIFVDNEKVFKEALNKGNYKEYFTDMFGGDFGHCTRKGNRLLAENIANAISKEMFNNSPSNARALAHWSKAQ